eukprot:4878234-Prymnesium_polylepis.1
MIAETESVECEMTGTKLSQDIFSQDKSNGRSAIGKFALLIVSLRTPDIFVPHFWVASRIVERFGRVEM